MRSASPTSYGVSWALRFSVAGQPVAQPRANPSLIRKKGGGFVTDKFGRPIVRKHTDGDHPIGLWKERIIRAYREAVAEAGIGDLVPVARKIPIALLSQYHILRPSSAKAWEIWKPTRPDEDNYVKGLQDALEFAGLYLGDGQVVYGPPMKLYSDDWQGVVVLVVVGDAVNLFADQIIRDRATEFSEIAAGEVPGFIRPALAVPQEVMAL